jgi:hypothetical protein
VLLPDTSTPHNTTPHHMWQLYLLLLARTTIIMAPRADGHARDESDSSPSTKPAALPDDNPKPKPKHNGKAQGNKHCNMATRQEIMRRRSSSPPGHLDRGACPHADPSDSSQICPTRCSSPKHSSLTRRWNSCRRPRI